MLHYVTFAVESAALPPTFFDNFGKLSRYLIKLPESCFPVEVSVFPNGRMGDVKSIAPFSIKQKGSTAQLSSRLESIFSQMLISASANMENGALYSPIVRLFNYEEEDVKWNPALCISKVENGKERKLLSSSEVRDINDVKDANALWVYILYMDLIGTPIGRNA